MAIARIAKDQGAAHRVVADDRLQMGARDFRRRQRERDAAIEQRDGGVPGDRERFRMPAVLPRPLALAMVRRAGIRDLVGDLDMLRRHLPEPGNGRERGGPAGLVMLADVTDRNLDSRAALGAVRQTLNEALVELVLIGLFSDRLANGP